jgi:hypothetical protein
MDEKDWVQVALPALEFIDECERSGELASTDAVVDHLGGSALNVTRELRNLVDDGFIAGVDVSTAGNHFALLNVRLLPPARRALRHWPQTFEADHLLQVLDRAIETAQGEERTRLEAVRVALGSAGKSVVSGLISGAATAAASGVL